MEKINQLVSRGVERVIPSKQELEKVLGSGRKLKVYQGFDPTSPQLHIGHLVGLRKLKQWQDAGHQVIFLVGDFTAMIGDPTGRDKTRTPLSREQVLTNAKAYKELAGRILRFGGKNPAIIKYNSQWLSKLSMANLLHLTSHLTYQQIIERDMFQRRIQKGKDVALSEFLYPFLQGYDSVAMDVDVEVGGSDQFFNMMTGRDLMRKLKRKEKFVMTTPLLTDAKGEKIGKTEGNAIAITGPAHKLFAAIMNLPDEIIISGLEWLTDVNLEEIRAIEKAIEKGTNPLNFKKRLAFEIVKQLDGRDAAYQAQEEFERVFQKGKKPKEAEPIKLSKSKWELINFLVGYNLVQSKSAAKRLVGQGAIEIDGQTITGNQIEFKNGQIVRIGKKKFVKVLLE